MLGASTPTATAIPHCRGRVHPTLLEHSHMSPSSHTPTTTTTTMTTTTATAAPTVAAIPAKVILPPQVLGNGAYVLQEMLGVGAYGSVYRARNVHSGQIVAIKSLNSAGLDPQQRAFQTRETELHRLVSGHPNIVRLHAVLEEGAHLHMILDCGNEGDLFSTITERGGFVGNDQAIKTIFGQIVEAVEHCHSCGVYHRDLKPENIIIFGQSVKLIDFGLATTSRFSSDFGCGSTFYLSPECQGGYQETVQFYDSAANDVWSLGVILINLVFGRNPWKQACLRDETFAAFTQNQNFLQSILPMSTELNEIIKGIFCLCPQTRISVSDLKRRVMACSSFTTPEFASKLASYSAATAAASAAAAAAAAAAATRGMMIPPTTMASAALGVSDRVVGANRVLAASVTPTTHADYSSDKDQAGQQTQKDSGVDVRLRA